MSSIISMNSQFEEMLGDIKYDHVKLGLYPFMVRVGVSKFRPPRHPYFEYMINLGTTEIENVLYHTGKLRGGYAFVFPERHMSVHEQRSFMYEFNKHPSAKDVTNVDIITSSPILVSDFMSDMIRILTWDDDKKLHPHI